MESCGKQAMAATPAALSVAAEDQSGSSDEELNQTPPEFYDPKMDERDHAWVERKRKGRKSDALLSCPACFTTLCLDCQRHESIVTQYRAMFVLNCKISEVEQRTQNPTRRKRGNSAIANSYQPTRNCDNLRPVSCAVCGTEVAVIDPDEVYHFHNVLPSFI